MGMVRNGSEVVANRTKTCSPVVPRMLNSQAIGNFGKAQCIVVALRFVDSESAPTNMETQLFRDIKP